MNSLLNKNVKELYKAILLLESENECKKFLGDLLTETEMNEFGNRWRVAQMLNEKIIYEEIEKETGMSSTTIARIQKWLNGKLGGYKLMLEKINKTKKTNHHSTRLAV